jgi:glycosyltransferase involved in cell wall biosynthesis
VFDSRYRIFVPAFNEELSIQDTLKDLLSFYSPLNIVVINDGSTDNTNLLVSDFEVNIHNHSKNQGIGAVLKTATRMAIELDLDFFVIFDGDGQHQASQIDKLIQNFICGRGDLLVGSRLRFEEIQTYEAYHFDLKRKIAIYLLSFGITKKFSVSILDITSGFRIYGKNTYPAILRLECDYYLADTVGSLVQILKDGNIVSEVPVFMINRLKGRRSSSIYNSIYNYFRIIKEILRA